MKKILLISALLLSSIFAFAGLNHPKNKSLFLKEKSTLKTNVSEFGNTLNIGLGFGYGNYAGVPIMLNYEIDVANNFTLAPFIGFGTNTYNERGGGYYTSKGEWIPVDDYYYRSIYIPIGLKGTFYFDELLGLIDPLDIYAAASLGFTYWNWSSNHGDFDSSDYRKSQGASALWLALHIGIEYHFNDKIGAFLDASTGMSTIGISIKM